MTKSKNTQPKKKFLGLSKEAREQDDLHNGASQLERRRRDLLIREIWEQLQASATPRTTLESLWMRAPTLSYDREESATEIRRAIEEVARSDEFKMLERQKAKERRLREAQPDGVGLSIDHMPTPRPGLLRGRR